MSEVTIIGIDLAKRVFHLAGSGLYKSAVISILFLEFGATYGTCRARKWAISLRLGKQGRALVNQQNVALNERETGHNLSELTALRCKNVTKRRVEKYDARL